MTKQFRDTCSSCRGTDLVTAFTIHLSLDADSEVDVNLCMDCAVEAVKITARNDRDLMKAAIRILDPEAD